MTGTAGSVGRGKGPCPGGSRGDEGHAGTTDPSRERDGKGHGSVTDVWPCDEDAGNDTLLPVLLRRSNHVTLVWGPYGVPKVDSASRGLETGLLRA